MKNSKSADRLIRKMLAGKASPEERERLTQCDIIEAKMKKQFKGGKDVVDDRTAEKRIWTKIDSKCQVTPAGNRRFHLKRWKVAVAACITALIVIGSALFFSTNNQAPTKVEEVIEYTQVHSSKSQLYLLPDSSKVWMKAGSNIRFARNFTTNREVWLEGESTFEVTKRAGKTFKVHIDRAFIEVKGTVFRVESNLKQDSEVTLLSGKINFNIPASHRTIEMHPQQKITFHAESNDITLKKTGNISWDKGRYKFSDIRLDELIDAINDIYNASVVLDKSVTQSHQFSGYMRYDEPLAKVIKKICVNMNLRLKTEGQTSIITSK